MSLNLNKSTWKRVLLGDVATASKEKVDPTDGSIERYVAGEHMASNDLKIRRWGDIGDVELGPAFHRRFRPGQVLYGSRRTYLRKVVVADFDGVCANTTFVVETKDSGVLLQEFLPFIMTAEPFHAFAIAESKGSVNPYVNWTDIEQYEFDLPPLGEQKRLAELLWEIETHSQALSALSRTLEGAKGSFIDEFLRSAAQIWPVKRLAELTTKITDGVHKRPNYVESGIPFLTVENLTRGKGIDFSSVRYVVAEDHKEFIKRTKPERGDVLVSKDGTLGVARVVKTDIEFSIFVSLALLKPIRNILDPEYLQAYFDSGSFSSLLAVKTSGSALKHIHLADFKSIEIPVPPYNVQAQFVAHLETLENSQNAIRSEVSALNMTRSSVISFVFSGPQ